MRPRLVPDLPIARPTIERRYGLMAEPLLFQTNHAALLAAADAAFGRFPVPTDDREPLVVGLYVEDRPGRPRRTVGSRDAADRALVTATDPGGTDARSTRVVNRTYGSTYLIARGSSDLAVADVDRGVAVGFVSPETALDLTTVRYSFLESMGLSMLARGRGYMTLHAAGVVRAGLGVVIQGPAGAGKSTLAMACARRGFGVFAEDAVFVRVLPAGIELWGTPWIQRLLPDARRLFPELAGLPDRLQANGETKIVVDLDSVQPGSAVPCAPAGPIVRLERGTGGPSRIEPVDPAGDGAALDVNWPWDGGWTAEHDRGLAMLARHGIHRLHMNGSPDEAVDLLERLLDGT